MNLTKRETIAAMAMQGVLAAINQDDCHPHCVASWAVELTDALISELDRTAPKCPKCEDGGTGPLCSKHVIYGATCKESLPVEYHFPDVKEMVPDEDGWIPHNPGDPMPCHPDDKVTVKLRRGEINNHRGGWFLWEIIPEFPESEIIKWKLAE